MNDFSLRGVLKKQFLDRSVKDLQPSSPISVSEDSPIPKVLEELKNQSIGSVLVVGENDMLRGIFTERDLLKNLSLAPESTFEQPISSVMTVNPEVIRQSASVARAIHAFSAGGFRHLPVIHTKEYPVGILSVKDVVRFVYRRLTKEHANFDCEVIGDDRLVERFFCGGVSILNPFPPLAVPETASLHEVLSKLQATNLGGVLITSPQGALSGIFTERDYVKSVMLKGLKLKQMPVVPYMTRDVKTVAPDSSVAEAVNLLWRGGFRHIPIVDENHKPVALLTVKNFMKCLADSIVHDLAQKKASHSGPTH